MVRAMGDSDEGGALRRPRRFFSLSELRSDLDRLYDDGGGPAPIRATVDRTEFERCCHEFPWSVIAPALIKYQCDATLAKRHWPWAAFAISQFQFEQWEAARHIAEPTPTPKEVLELLGEIRDAAKRLSGALARLQSTSFRVVEPADRMRSGHLQYLDQFISQAAAGLIDREVREDGEHLVRVFNGKEALLRILIEIEVAAGEAMNRADKTLLSRKVGTRQMPGLHRLVFRASEIWISMTGREASANKVYRRDEQEPQFVQFIHDLVGIAGGPNPSRRMVEIALTNLAPRNTTKKNP
jgi:hypothetical protein